MEEQVLEQVAEQTNQTTTEPTTNVEQKTVAPQVQDKVDTASLATEVAKYTPNLKFKASGKELDVPEIFQGLIKDEKAEKYVKGVLERAYGLDQVKEHNLSLKNQYKEVSTELSTLKSTIGELSQAYQQGDLDTVWEQLGISPDKVLMWAVKKVEASQLPPEQQKAMEEARMAQKQVQAAQKSQIELQQQAVQQQATHLGQMLDLVLERPDYSAVAKAYDSRKQSPGSFRNLVIKMGEIEYHQTGKVISPLDAAKKALDILGDQSLGSQSSTQTPQQAVVEQKQEQQVTQKKVLPNLANAGAKSNSSPAKGKIKSLDDLKKKYDQITNNIN